MSPGEKKKRNIKASAKLGMHKHADEFLYIYILSRLYLLFLFLCFSFLVVVFFWALLEDLLLAPKFYFKNR